MGSVAIFCAYDILGISKSKAYDFVRDAYKNGDSFRVIKIAGTYRIPKKSFDKWLQGA